MAHRPAGIAECDTDPDHRRRRRQGLRAARRGAEGARAQLRPGRRPHRPGGPGMSSRLKPSARPAGEHRGRLLDSLGYCSTLFVLVFGMGAWGAVAAHLRRGGRRRRARGEGNRQVVQHPTGGVIKAIHARDGDEVKAGDVLVELEGDDLLPELGIVEGQWFEMLARKSRLNAERDGLDDDHLRSRADRRAPTSPEIRDADRGAAAAVRRPAQAAVARRRRSSTSSSARSPTRTPASRRCRRRRRRRSTC